MADLTELHPHGVGRAAVVVVVATFTVVGGAIASSQSAPVGDTRPGGGGRVALLVPSPATAHARAERKVPTARSVRDAWRYAGDRGGEISFAVVDTQGELRGRAETQQYASASVVKAMLLSAELRRLNQAGERIDSSTDSLFTAMITYSDNDAATAIYSRVGDVGLNRVAQRAGMRGFTVAGHWGNAQITAADMARFFADLDRMLPRRFRVYGKGLLGSVIESQRWGIPQAAGDEWAVRFKGGWLPDHALVHQAAELRERDGSRELAIAILTDAQPSHAYGVATVRGVAARLLGR